MSRLRRHLPDHSRRARIFSSIQGRRRGRSGPRRRLQLNYGLVEYVSERTHVGEMGPPKKFDRFAHQSEFRFYIDPGFGKPLTLTLGSLEYIANRGLIAPA